VAGGIQENRERIGGALYGQWGSADMAKYAAAGDFAAMGNRDPRSLDKANWQLDQIAGPDGNPRDVFYNKSGPGGEMYDANTQLGISNLGRGGVGSDSRFAGPGDTLLDETDYTNMEKARTAVGDQPIAPSRPPGPPEPPLVSGRTVGGAPSAPAVPERKKKKKPVMTPGAQQFLRTGPRTWWETQQNKTWTR